MSAVSTIVTIPDAKNWPEVHKARAVIMRRHGDEKRRRTSLLDYDLLLTRMASCYSLPGGGIQPGEDSLTAAIREVEEEVGTTPEPNIMVDALDVALGSCVHPAFTVRHLQQGYRPLDGRKEMNRIVVTDYWLMNLNEIDLSKCTPHLTREEEFNHLVARFYAISEIQNEILDPKTQYVSARRRYCNNELQAVIDNLADIFERAARHVNYLLLP